MVKYSKIARRIKARGRRKYKRKKKSLAAKVKQNSMILRRQVERKVYEYNTGQNPQQLLTSTPLVLPMNDVYPGNSVNQFRRIGTKVTSKFIEFRGCISNLNCGDMIRFIVVRWPEPRTNIASATDLSFVLNQVPVQTGELFVNSMYVAQRERPFTILKDYTYCHKSHAERTRYFDTNQPPQPIPDAAITPANLQLSRSYFGGSSLPFNFKFAPKNCVPEYGAETNSSPTTNSIRCYILCNRDIQPGAPLESNWNLRIDYAVRHRYTDL